MSELVLRIQNLTKKNNFTYDLTIELQNLKDNQKRPKRLSVQYQNVVQLSEKLDYLSKMNEDQIIRLASLQVQFNITKSLSNQQSLAMISELRDKVQSYFVQRSKFITRFVIKIQSQQIEPFEVGTEQNLKLNWPFLKNLCFMGLKMLPEFRNLTLAPYQFLTLLNLDQCYLSNKMLNQLSKAVWPNLKELYHQTEYKESAYTADGIKYLQKHCIFQLQKMAISSCFSNQVAKRMMGIHTLYSLQIANYFYDLDRDQLIVKDIIIRQITKTTNIRNKYEDTGAIEEWKSYLALIDEYKLQI